MSDQTTIWRNSYNEAKTRIAQLEVELQAATRKGEELCVQNGNLLVANHNLEAHIKAASEALEAMVNFSGTWSEYQRIETQARAVLAKIGDV